MSSISTIGEVEVTNHKEPQLEAMRRMSRGQRAQLMERCLARAGLPAFRVRDVAGLLRPRTPPLRRRYPSALQLLALGPLRMATA